MDNKVLKKAIKTGNEEEINKALEYIYTKYYKLVYFIIYKYIYNILMFLCMNKGIIMTIIFIQI